MRITGRARVGRRGGVAIVEAAITFGLYSMLLFGVFEFTRYLYLIQVAVNAARDAARLAACNISNPSADWNSTAGTNDPTYGTDNPYFTVQAINDHVTGTDPVVVGGVETKPGTPGKLYGLDRTALKPRPLAGGGTLPIVQIFPVDAGTLYQDPPVFKPRKQPDTAANPPITTASWKNARFPEKVAVRVTGRYTPLMPLFVPIKGKSEKVYSGPDVIDVVVLVTSEG